MYFPLVQNMYFIYMFDVKGGKNVDSEKIKISISLFFIILLYCQKVKYTIAFWQSIRILANEILID